MKKNCFFILAISLLFNSYAPAQTRQVLSVQTFNERIQQSGKSNFYEIQKEFQEYEAEVDSLKKESGVATEEFKRPFPGYNQYKRWEWFNEKRVYPSGEFPSNEMILSEYDKFIRNRSSSTGRNNNLSMAPSQTWANLGSANAPVGSYAGTGRVNCLTFMPGNNNSILIGAACGGVWKSTNSGLSWNVLNTDQLPSISITSIAIDPTDTNKIYIATGDNFTGFVISGVLKQGHFSAGIYKSTDGGGTWVLAGMPSIQSQQFIPQQMVLDPVNPAVMLLASNTGIWRTVNNGANWTMVRANFFYSVEFNPLNHNVAYATDGTGLWRSNDNGLTWTYKGGGYPNAAGGRVTLAVTPADTNYIYVWGPTAGFKKSVNGGNTLVTMASPDAIAQPYGYVDRSMGVSKTNKLDVMVGGVTTAKSIDGGVTWNSSSDYQNYLLPNYFHVDVKKIIYEPGSGTKLYALHDGGVAVSTDNSTTWTDISNGLQIGEIYKIASSPFHADSVYMGLQDNGAILWDGTSNTTDLVYPGDGFQPLVYPTDPRTIFVSFQLGSLQKSTDGGATFTQASPGQALWDPPIKMNALNPQTMYFGCTAGVKKNYTGGLPLGSWVNVSAGTLVNVIALDVTKADTNYIYAASLSELFKSTNGGTSWTNVTAGLPVGSAAITYIVVSPSDPQSVYVTFSGYSAGNKVFKSTNAGVSWVNFSGTLPNVPVNSMMYVNGSNQGVYAATDFGVFYRDAVSADWISYNNGLPNVIVNHLDIYYPTMKLRAGTYGRGLWESDLELPTANFSASPVAGCDSTQVIFSDLSTGNADNWIWSFPGGIPASSTAQNPVVNYSAPGNYSITLIVSNQNAWDTIVGTFVVHSVPVPSITANTSLDFCIGDSVVLSANGGIAFNWSNGASTQSITVFNSGVFDVTVTFLNGCSSQSPPLTVNVFPLPAVPTISAVLSLLTSSAATGNQWFLNGSLVNGATSQNYSATQSGNYSVVVTDSNGCSSTSALYNFIVTGTDLSNAIQLLVFPNPTSGKFMIDFNGRGVHKLQVYNSIGAKVFESDQNPDEIDLSGKGTGVYFLLVYTKDKKYETRFLLE